MAQTKFSFNTSFPGIHEFYWTLPTHPSLAFMNSIEPRKHLLPWHSWILLNPANTSFPGIHELYLTPPTPPSLSLVLANNLHYLFRAKYFKCDHLFHRSFPILPILNRMEVVIERCSRKVILLITIFMLLLVNNGVQKMHTQVTNTIS